MRTQVQPNKHLAAIAPTHHLYDDSMRTLVPAGGQPDAGLDNSSDLNAPTSHNPDLIVQTVILPDAPAIQTAAMAGEPEKPVLPPNASGAEPTRKPSLLQRASDALHREEKLSGDDAPHDDLSSCGAASLLTQPVLMGGVYTLASLHNLGSLMGLDGAVVQLVTYALLVICMFCLFLLR